MIKKIFLLTGSNLGDSVSNLEMAAKAISEEVGGIIRKSAIYKSESWGYESNRKFFNQCLEVESEFSAHEILDRILKIEKKMGRVRKGNNYSDRIIDIDILFFGGDIIEDAMLSIPHPRLHLRRFALFPMNEIAPNFIHPLIKKSIRILLDECGDIAMPGIY